MSSLGNGLRPRDDPNFGPRLNKDLATTAPCTPQYTMRNWLRYGWIILSGHASSPECSLVCAAPVDPLQGYQTFLPMSSTAVMEDRRPGGSYQVVRTSLHVL